MNGFLSSYVDDLVWVGIGLVRNSANMGDRTDGPAGEVGLTSHSRLSTRTCPRARLSASGIQHASNWGRRISYTTGKHQGGSEERSTSQARYGAAKPNLNTKQTSSGEPGHRHFLYICEDHSGIDE